MYRNKGDPNQEPKPEGKIRSITHNWNKNSVQLWVTDTDIHYKDMIEGDYEETISLNKDIEYHYEFNFFDEDDQQTISLQKRMQNKKSGGITADILKTQIQDLIRLVFYSIYFFNIFLIFFLYFFNINKKKKIKKKR